MVTADVGLGLQQAPEGRLLCASSGSSMGTLTVSPDPQHALLSQRTLEIAESHGQRLMPFAQP